LGKKKRFLFECKECKAVFTCNGECDVENGIPCICPDCAVNLGCNFRRIKNPKLVLLAKLKKVLVMEVVKRKKGKIKERNLDKEGRR